MKLLHCGVRVLYTLAILCISRIVRVKEVWCPSTMEYPCQHITQYDIKQSLIPCSG